MKEERAMNKMEKYKRDLGRAFQGMVWNTFRLNVTPTKIRKDGLVTVVFWQDGTATSVRCGAGETYDDYVAFCAALAKKLFLSNSGIKRVLKNTPVEYVGGDGPVDVDIGPLAPDPTPMTGKSYTFNISSVEVKDLD